MRTRLVTFLIRPFAALIAVVALLTVAVAPNPAPAQQTLRAAAVVNDEVISVLDLEMRVRLALLASGLNDSRQQRQRIAPQVLRTLIDERLQLQEAARLGYDITEAEIEEALNRVANNNDMSADTFITMLRQNDILPSVFRAQTRAGIAWQKVVQRRLRPQVEISDEEVDDVVERIRQQQGQQQYRVREIFLSVDETGTTSEVRQTAQRLVEELRRGADFAALARQFSQSATAAVGGEIGWVTPDNVPDAVADALTQMEPGEIAGPLESFNGFHIVRLADTRVMSSGDPSVDLKQVFLPVPEDGDEAAGRERLQGVAEQIDGCAEAEEAVGDDDRLRVSDIEDVHLADLPSNIRAEIVTLDIDEPSQPLPVTGGLAVLTVCARDGGDIDREQIRENLVNERLNMIAQRHLRDLRRQAHIDIRL